MKNHTKIFLSLSSGLMTLPIFGLSSCYFNDKIIFANFESYISNQMIHRLHESYPISFLYYSTNEEIESKFKNYYDIAVPSTYEMLYLKETNQLEEIDWNFINDRYHLIPDNTNNLTGSDFKKFFSPTMNQIFEAFYQQYHFEMLDYCIPYFLQSLAFAYKGSIIPELLNNIDWNQLTTIISPENLHQDDRFNPTKNHNHKIGLIDDARTNYAIAQLINSNNQTVNPENANQTIDQFINQYDQFLSKFKANKNTFLLNSDSGTIINSLADSNGLNAAIAYNGDLLYAAKGAGINQGYDNESFHYINPDKTLLALDCVVINKNSTNHLNKKQQIYDIVYQTTLQGCNYDIDHLISQKDGQYECGPMLNFNFINYTSPLNNINQYACDRVNGYFDNDLLRQIYQINLPNNFNINDIMEINLNSLSKSNMHWAYENVKNKL